MVSSSIIWATVLQAISVSAIAGNAVIQNKCPFDLYVRSEDSVKGPGPIIKIAARSSYTEPIRKPTTGGVSFKTSKSPEIQYADVIIDPNQPPVKKETNITQLEYTVGNNVDGYDLSKSVFYDTSFVDCVHGDIGAFDTTDCPGWEMGITITPPQGCKSLVCPASTECLDDAYYVDIPVQKLNRPEPNSACTFDTPDKTLVFTMCENQPAIKRSIAGRISYEHRY